MTISGRRRTHSAPVLNATFVAYSFLESARCVRGSSSGRLCGTRGCILVMRVRQRDGRNAFSHGARRARAGAPSICSSNRDNQASHLPEEISAAIHDSVSQPGVLL
nr:hypothetical protein CFP56_66478 [Quercus suber]